MSLFDAMGPSGGEGGDGGGIAAVMDQHVARSAEPGLGPVELSCLPACCLSDVVSTSSATIITATAAAEDPGKGKPLLQS